jgi:hypothetical protein
MTLNLTKFAIKSHLNNKSKQLSIMKKTILMALLALLGMTQMVAQEYEYVPFVREGVKWVYIMTRHDEVSETNVTQIYNLEFFGDTVINGKVYKAMHKYSGKNISSENDTIPVYMREKNRIVYAIIPDGVSYPGCPVGLYYNNADIYGGVEFIFCDFNDPAGFWVNEIYEMTGNEDYYHLIDIDTIQVGGNPAKRYKSAVGENETNFYVVEGIGYDSKYGYTLFPFVPYFYGSPVLYGLSHVIKDGEIIYKGMRYDENHYTAVDEVVADQRRPLDSNYYDLMGRAVGKDVPTTPGIYIHNGNKICVGRK